MAKRKRAPRGGLSAERIVESALQIANEEGLSALTVRKLAVAMEVSPMAIYGHFRNKAEIVDALLGAVIRAFDVTGHTQKEPRAWVLECFRRMRVALLRHPGVTPLLGTGASVSTESLGVLEKVVEVLRGVCGSDGAAAESFYAMLSFTVGTVHIEQGMRRMLKAGEMGGASELATRLSPHDGATLLALAPQLVAQAEEGPFLRTLEGLCPRA